MELSIEFTIPNTPLFRGEGAAIVDEELRATTEGALAMLQGAIQPLTPVGATGVLRAGVQTSITGEGVDLTGRVFDPVAYAGCVEDGTRPHFPPSSALLLWVQRVLGVSSKDAPSVAFLVARAISRRGTPARNMFKEAFETYKPTIEGMYAAAVARIVQRLGGAQ